MACGRGGFELRSPQTVGVADDKDTTLKPVTALTAADWESHLPYLRDCYKEWQFTEMQTHADSLIA
jgi:hypothetical protein